MDTHVYKHKYIHYICTYVCAHNYDQICIRTLTPMHTLVYAHPQTCTHLDTQTHICTCACKHRIYCPNTLGSASHSLKPYDLVTFMAHLLCALREASTMKLDIIFLQLKAASLQSNTVPIIQYVLNKYVEVRALQS